VAVGLIGCRWGGNRWNRGTQLADGVARWEPGGWLCCWSQHSDAVLLTGLIVQPHDCVVGSVVVCKCKGLRGCCVMQVGMA
jgi:hypothetical protein